MTQRASQQRTLPQTIGWILAILGMIGFLASFTLAVEKVALLKDPSYSPSCNLSPILSCGSVMVMPQAEAFGFPNPFIGIAGFAVVTTVGMALLAGAALKRWFWLGLQAGTVFGIGFVSWLAYQSIFNIGALCPYCMVVWAVMIPIFWYTTLHNVRQGHIRLSGGWQALGAFLNRNHGNGLLVLYLIPLLIILVKFWYYWSTIV